MEEIKITKILCVFARTDRGGAESMFMNIYRNIDRTKVQFDFIKHTNDNCAFDEEIRALGGVIYSAPKYRVYNHLLYRKWWNNFYKKHKEYKIIHVHTHTIAAVILKIAKKNGLITIAHSHGNCQIRDNLKSIAKYFIERKTEKYSDYCLACGEEAGKWLFPNREYKVINNAIDTSKYKYSILKRKKIRKELGVENNFVIGVVGRMQNQKNPHGIIDIFQYVLKQDKTAKLLWCGDGELFNEVRDRINRLNLKDDVILLGVRTDIDCIMQAFDVYIMPSLAEGVPVAGIEAQCAGLPCIFGDNVPRETNLTGNCWFIPISNIKYWGNTIENLKKFVRKSDCSKIIEAGYDINSSVKWIQQFYLDIYNKYVYMSSNN